MTAKGLSQPQVAALAKQHGYRIDQTTVGRIARGAMPTTVDTLDALAAGLGVEGWQLLVPDLDPAELPKLGFEGLTNEERGLIADFRGASGRWKIAVRYMAGLRQDNEQEEVASGLNILLAKILGAKAYPVEKMNPAGWTRPDKHQATALTLQEPKAGYQTERKPKRGKPLK